MLQGESHKLLFRGDERIDDIGIELRAPILDNLGPRVDMGSGLFVGPLRGEGVVYIHHELRCLVAHQFTTLSGSLKMKFTRRGSHTTEIRDALLFRRSGKRSNSR
tara:strand:+ start:798 stop:1112 length:315 start_codon:yes stop_codon:yes gene_type:complete